MAGDDSRGLDLRAFLRELGGHPLLRWQPDEFREAFAHGAKPLNPRSARRLFADLRADTLEGLLVLGPHTTVLATTDVDLGDGRGRWRTVATLREGAVLGSRALGTGLDGDSHRQSGT